MDEMDEQVYPVDDWSQQKEHYEVGGVELPDAQIILESDLPTPLPSTGQECGIDLGLKKLATLDNGESYPNPRPLLRASAMLRKANRSFRGAKKVATDGTKPSAGWPLCMKKLSDKEPATPIGLVGIL